MLTKNTDKFREVTWHHIADDLVIQGDYFDAGRGCFIGCHAHGNKPQFLETEYGIPLMLTRIAESIFERLPVKDAPLFFGEFADALRDGQDLTRVSWAFLAQILRDLPAQDEAAQAVIEGLDLLACGEAWADAASAASAADASWADASWADAASAADASWAAAKAAAAVDPFWAAVWAGAAAKAAKAADAALRSSDAAAGPGVQEQRKLLITLIKQS